MEKFKQLIELDKMAFDFVNIPAEKISSLKFDERTYITTLANLYTIYALEGSKIKDKVVKIKQKALKDYNQIHTELYFERLNYHQWIQSIKKTERTVRELRKSLKEGDLQTSLEQALSIIDTLLRENTLVNMYRATMQSQNPVHDKDISTAVEHYAEEYNLEIKPNDVEKIVYQFLHSLGTSEELLCFKSMTDEEVEEYAKRLPEREIEGVKTDVSSEYIKALSAG